MSVLNFPRIYVNGHMFWNPPTANNNDVLPLYDAVKMQMNWPFLKAFKITESNAQSKLLPWIISPLDMDKIPDYVLQLPGNGVTEHYPMIPAEWDLFGDNACGTVNYRQIKSMVVGGELQANTYIDQDALINKGYQLVGNPFGNSNPTPARFVDVSPWQNTFTALYFDKLVLGDANCGLTLNRQHRMLDRFLNFNWGALGGLNYVTTTWQSCFPKENLQWIIGDSQLLQQLQSQMEQKNAKGLMFRFSTYLTFYDKNGIFNDYPPIDTRDNSPQALAKLQALYQQGLDNVADMFFNPAYSRTAGTLGLWFDHEFPTAPAGKRLVAKNPVPLYKLKNGNEAGLSVNPDAIQGISLGVILAEQQGDILSLDLSNTFPFYPVDSTASIPVAAKFYAGSYDLGVTSDRKFTPVTTLRFDQYNQSAFDLRSGLVDIVLTENQQQQLQAGQLELRLQGAKAGQETAAQQLAWTAEVVESGNFIDVGDTKTLTIMVQHDGRPAPENTVLWVAEYGNPFMLTTSNYYLAFSNDANFPVYLNFPDDISNNQGTTPQFVHAQQQNCVAQSGTGRTLQSMQAQDDAQGTPVYYQDYLKTPAAVSLAPCLQFTNPIAKQGQLQEPPQSQVNYQLTTIKTDAQGIAQLTIKAVSPGFPTLRFFVQQAQKEPDIEFSFSVNNAYTDFLAPLRVLPSEPELQQDFINYWNSIYQHQDARMQVWLGFVYPRILQPFYYLYPIMNKYMPLNSLQRIEGAIDQFIVLISKAYQEESTLAMPITRDLPQSRRAVLELWAKSLVKRNYPPMPLSLSDFNN